MKTSIHFLSHLVQFFSEWENFQTKVVEKNKTNILFLITFFRKLFHLLDNVQIYCEAGRDKDDYGACALHVGYLGLQIQTENM